MNMDFTVLLNGIVKDIATVSFKEAIIIDLALIIILSALFAFVAKLLHQPLIPAYVLSGFFIGPIVLGLISDAHLILQLSEIGIAFLLFTAGLEISFKKIEEANLKKIIIVGMLQVVLIFALTLAMRQFINLELIQAMYIGIILAFGSTMVVVKLLADSNELVTMHGRLVLGILLLQDFVAIFAIILLSSSGFALIPVISSIIKILAIVSFAFVLQKLILNPIFGFAAKSQELLFIMSLAVLFLFVGIAHATNLSIVIGAFIAGVSLANSPFKLELESKISPLRDFFSIMFFVALGMQIVISGIIGNFYLFIFLVLVAIVIKPLITFILLRSAGYKSKTSFLTSSSLAQLSEFSLIIGLLGVNLGILSSSIFSTIILATIITMALTTYSVKYKEFAYKIFKKPLDLFGFLPVREHLEYNDNRKKEVLLIGAHRMGSILLNELISEKGKANILVIDFNPEIINFMTKMKVPCIYGDVGSPEILDKIDISKLKLVINTVPDLKENLRLLKRIKKSNSDAKMIATASRISEAYLLYDHGADYVILPKVIAGEDAIKIIKNNKNLDKIRKRHIKALNSIHNLLY